MWSTRPAWSRNAAPSFALFSPYANPYANPYAVRDECRKTLENKVLFGAGKGIKSQLLYQLSYASICRAAKGAR
jgi:hypothetical protein